MWQQGVTRMNVALILSGGVGTRLGAGIPKQYIEVGQKPILLFCLETLHKSKEIDAVQIVADVTWQDKIRNWMKQFGCLNKLRGFSLPGENRQLSIYHGLKDIAEYASEGSCVMVHDAARPFLSEEMISQSMQAIKGHDGVLPVLAMKDTVYLSEDGKRISSLLERQKIFAGQAPETFLFGKYLRANETLVSQNKILEINGSTEPAIMAGLDIVMIPGDERNFKITSKADLEHFRDLVGRGIADESVGFTQYQ